MKRTTTIILMAILWASMKAAERDTLMLSLGEAIQLARQQSPEAQSARNTFLTAYWNYRYYRANYLPSVTLTSSPYINKEMNKITQSWLIWKHTILEIGVRILLR